MMTTPHGFSDGDMVVFTNILWGAGEKSNGLFDPMFGEISNVTDSTFDIAIDTTGLASISSANVTRINGGDQEGVYRKYLQWMINQGHGGQDANGILARTKITATLSCLSVSTTSTMKGGKKWLLSNLTELLMTIRAPSSAVASNRRRWVI